MEIHDETVGAVTVLALSGKMDAMTSPGVEEHLLKLIDGGAVHVVLDLSQLDYISSVGLRVFILAGKRLTMVKGTLALCAPEPQVRQILQIAGFHTLFAIHDTRAAALGAT